MILYARLKLDLYAHEIYICARNVCWFGVISLPLLLRALVQSGHVVAGVPTLLIFSFSCACPHSYAHLYFGKTLGSRDEESRFCRRYHAVTFLPKVCRLTPSSQSVSIDTLIPHQPDLAQT